MHPVVRKMLRERERKQKELKLALKMVRWEQRKTLRAHVMSNIHVPFGIRHPYRWGGD